MKNKGFLVLLGNICIILVLALLIAPMPAFSAPAAAKPIKILFASFGPPSEPHTPSFEAWAKELKERSKGRVEVEISYGGALARPGEHYGLARTGVAEVAWVGLPYTPGRFPISEIMGLPIQAPSAEILGKAYWELYKRGYLDKEFAEVKVLYLFCTGPYQFMWGKNPLNSLAELKGRKVRASGGVQTKAIAVLGATPVGMSSGETYLAMQKGIIDGNLGSWSSVKTWNLQEVMKYATEINLFGYPFAVVMNKDFWNKLPKDIQAIIDDMSNSGKYTVMAGQGHDQWREDSKELLKKAGGRIGQLSAADTKKMLEMLKPLWDKWVADVEAKGLPGRKALDELYSILNKLGVETPFAR